jgi:hypothetical protein
MGSCCAEVKQNYNSLLDKALGRLRKSLFLWFKGLESSDWMAWPTPLFPSPRRLPHARAPATCVSSSIIPGTYHRNYTQDSRAHERHYRDDPAHGGSRIAGAIRSAVLPVCESAFEEIWEKARRRGLRSPAIDAFMRIAHSALEVARARVAGL